MMTPPATSPEWTRFCFHASADDEPWPTLSKARINDSSVTGYAQDQSDIQYGYVPRSLAADGIHLLPMAKRFIEDEYAAAIDAVRKL